MRRSCYLVCALVFVIFSAKSALAEEILELDKSFIEKYKNALTISVHYFVDAAHTHPNTPKKDGDLHIAGRAPEIGLAVAGAAAIAKMASAKIFRHMHMMEQS